MNKRRANMQRYNAIRSAKVDAMISMLKSIDDGPSKLNMLGIYDTDIFKDQLNSYRAMKIAQYFNINVSKSKLTQFSKPKNYVYNLTAFDLMSFIGDNHHEFVNYWEWFKQPAIRKAKEKYPTEEELKNKD